MRAPAFWQRNGVVPALLAPLGFLYAAATARRVARPGWHAPVPVICCGNAGAGGAGKTTLALDLGARLAARGRRFAFITRGYGGRLAGPLRADIARHTAEGIGDEALLLAEAGPTYVGADRAASARLAVADGACALIMDDGLQNPGLVKDYSILVIDGEAGFGNGRVIPAGPLREPVAAAAARCGAALLIGPDRTGALAALPSSLPVLRASLRSSPEVAELAGQAVLAFAGIGRPEKFFETLQRENVQVSERMKFPDHFFYGDADLRRIEAMAAERGLIAVTTPKDLVRIPPSRRAGIRAIGVQLVWEDPSAPERLLDAALAGAP